MNPQNNFPLSNESDTDKKMDSNEKTIKTKPNRRKRQRSKFEQYDKLKADFLTIADIHGLLPACALSDFFQIRNKHILNLDEVFLPIGNQNKRLNDFYLLTMNYAYLLVGIEIYSIDDIEFQSRFLVEFGYAINNCSGAPFAKDHKVLMSIEELGNFIIKFKKYRDVPFLLVT